MTFRLTALRVLNGNYFCKRRGRQKTLSILNMEMLKTLKRNSNINKYFEEQRIKDEMNRGPKIIGVGKEKEDGKELWVGNVLGFGFDWTKLCLQVELGLGRI